MADGARYTLTVSRREIDPEPLPIVTASFDDSHTYAIAQISTEDDHTGSYWIDTWGGTIETPDPDASVVIGNRYLQEVGTLDALKSTPWSYYIDTAASLIWTRTEPYAWQYDAPAGANRAESQFRFSSAVSDPSNPSDDTIDGIRYPVRLKIPSTPLKLSTPTHGISLSDITSFSIAANDGNLDGNLDEMIHSRVRLRKSYNGGPFKTIYVGEVMDLKNTFKDIQLKTSQRFGGLTQAATKTIGEAFGEFLNRYDITDGADGKKCPRIYGHAPGVELVKVGTVKNSDPEVSAYVYHDPTALTGAVEVKGIIYDNGTGVLTGWDDVAVGILEVPTETGVPEFADIKTVDAVGGTTYTAVTAVRDMLTDLASIPLDDTAWDTTELAETVTESSTEHIGAIINSGTVRSAVESFLKNGLYHLLETPDGRLTVRIFGRQYSTYILPEWIHTENPQIYFYDKKILTTSARVGWKHLASFLFLELPSTPEAAKRWTVYDAEESRLLTEGGRAQRLEIETDLVDRISAEALAQNLVGYFGKRPKVVEVTLGDDLSDLVQLDTIETGLSINGRALNAGSSYIVADIDRSQDKALLLDVSDLGEVSEIHETGFSTDTIEESGNEADEIYETGVTV